MKYLLFVFISSVCSIKHAQVFQIFFVLVMGEAVAHNYPLYARLYILLLFGIGHRQVLFMRWVWVHLLYFFLLLLCILSFFLVMFPIIQS